MNKRTVSVACTSFNRPDLLERTLASFFRYNTYPIERFIVLDDSGEVGCNDHLSEQFHTVEFQYNPSRLGQVESIDIMYGQLDSRYIFHLEEDWEFYKIGFIENSLTVLESDPCIINVWIRSEFDTNGHPFSFEKRNPTPFSDSLSHSFMHTFHKGWRGFSFNPGLRRMGDYFQHGPYSSIATFEPSKPWTAEKAIGEYFYMKGYLATIIRGNGYVRHIGNGRGVRG